MQDHSIKEGLENPNVQPFFRTMNKLNFFHYVHVLEM